MDMTFLTGVGAVVSAVIVFCGSVWLLLTMVMGARLAYFVTASVTLAFLVMMGLVWAFTNATSPLGPVGDLPEYLPEALGEAGSVEFAAADSYPEDPWRVPDENDETQTNKAADAESTALEIVEQQLTEGKIDIFEDISEAQAVPDSARFLQQDGTEYAAVLVGPIEQGGGETEVDPQAENTLVVVMQFDPGNSLGPAKLILLGTFILFVLHLFGLGRAEAKVRRLRESAV
jgi:hypothetical protein